jgi:DHA1 family multidrug resistance protein-like MFS transporter
VKVIVIGLLKFSVKFIKISKIGLARTSLSVTSCIVFVTYVIFLSIDILRPAISTQMSMVAQEQQGYVAGLNSAFTSLGNIIGPIAAGILFDVNVNFPYVVAGIVLILSFGLTLLTGKKRLQRANNHS